MTISRGITTVIGCIAAGCLFGGAVGWGVGAFSPGLIRGLLHPSNPIAESEAAGIGLGLGVINGAWAGVGVGLTIVVAVTWYEVKKLSLHSPGP